MKRLILIVVVAIALCFAGVALAEKAYTPSTNDQFDLGTDKLQYKDARIAGDIYIEGATHNASETKLTVTDPTADRTITLQDASGTVMYTTDAFAGALADTQVYIGQSTGLGAAKAISGDATLANTGALTIGAGKIGNSESAITWSDVTVAGSGTSGTATVTAGSAVIGYFPVANVHDGNINGVASFGVSGTTLTLTINGTAGSNAVVYTVVSIAP
jgi:hypothetical protein